MTLPIDIENTEKALFSDGSWHIMPKELWHEKFESYDYPHQSVIYHQCRNYWEKHGDSKLWFPPVQYRVSVHELNIPCASCHETCPEGLQGLWKLHNYDSLQSEGD